MSFFEIVIMLEGLVLILIINSMRNQQINEIMMRRILGDLPAAIWGDPSSRSTFSVHDQEVATAIYQCWGSRNS